MAESLKHSEEDTTIDGDKVYENKTREWRILAIFFFSYFVLWCSIAHLSQGNAAFPQSYLLSYSYMDQITWGSRRVRSLQCWATELNRNIRVVEPFVNGSYLSIPHNEFSAEVLRFGDIFDLNWWNTLGAVDQGFAPLVTWNEFLENAPLPTILVQIVYEKNDMCLEPLIAKSECNLDEMRQNWLQTARQYNLSSQIVKEVCIDFQKTDFLNADEFNERIFGSFLTFWKYKPITVVFSDYRGGRLTHKVIGENTCLLRTRDSHCSPDGENMHQLIVNSLKPIPQIYQKAKEYTLKHFNTEDDYVAVMVRWELIFLNDLYFRGPHYTGATCIDKIQAQVEKWLMDNRLSKVFLTTDIGKYGSSTFPLHRRLYNQDNNQVAISHTEQLFRTFNYTFTNVDEYEDTFVQVAGTAHSTYISQLQKTIAARARCLLIVGWSSFHENAVALYNEIHSRNRCLEQIRIC